MANRGSIDQFLALVNANGGMSLSNSYLVKFELPDLLKTHLDSVGVSFTNNSNDLVELMCDEAQLPNINAATGNIIGKYLGQGQVEYPTSKVFTDFQLTWMCDANMTPHKFVTAWFDFMFAEESPTGEIYTGSTLSNKDFNDVIADSSPRLRGRSTKLRFPSSYQSRVLIGKAETGPNSATHRVPEIYVMEDVFPYSVDAVPLSYGASQVTKVSANFKYTRHYIIYNDIKNLGRK